MKVFTVTTEHPEWESLTRECILRLKAYGGVQEVKVFTAKDQWDAHVLKLTTPLEFEEFVWFVDSDWWQVQPFDLPQIPEEGIAAVHCKTGHERYKTTCADTSKVFASTIIGMDMRSWRVRHCFREAQAMQKAFYWNGKPKMDELFLNISALKNRIPISYMSYDWLHNCPRRPDTIGVHAGSMWPKLEWLKRAVEKSID